MKNKLLVVLVILLMVTSLLFVFEYNKYDDRKIRGGPQKINPDILQLFDNRDKCDWKPEIDYGVCEVIIGYYHDGIGCVALSGCGDYEKPLPFNSFESCQRICE